MGQVRASKFVVRCCGIVVLVLAAGCQTEFEQRYEEAERLRRQAAEQGFEWIGTAGLLEQAQVQAGAGNNSKALEFVEKARFQADAAIRQAEHEAEAWKSRVVR